ncbi:hypothetical protein M5689_011762 [Euphorbia peplus]|nr:hypothetical protein M5689_011762 [Euphorbia peplus]
MMKQTPSEAHPETMDFLSKTWCNFAVQALQPPDQSLVVRDNTSIKTFDGQMDTNFKSVKMDESDFKSLPPWKSNDVKSWIWMQQSLHPELNYKRRKWFSWKIAPLKSMSIKKWMKEMKEKRKEEDRLERAQVHAAISVAGIAAALAAIAADNSRKGNESKGQDDAVASAAGLVAAQCAKMAEAMGAKREQLTTVIGSAMTASTATDILTLTAAASTSLKGAATLKARKGYNYNKVLNGNPHIAVLPISENNTPKINFDLEKWQSILAHGTELHVETPDGNFGVRSISIFLNSQAKVILRMRKLNFLKSKKESIITEVQAEYYRDSSSTSSREEERENGTCYLIVLSTNKGITKVDMGDDYHQYKRWATTINHLLFLSSNSSFTYHI